MTTERTPEGRIKVLLTAEEVGLLLWCDNSPYFKINKYECATLKNLLDNFLNKAHYHHFLLLERTYLVDLFAAERISLRKFTLMNGWEEYAHIEAGDLIEDPPYFKEFEA